MGKRIPCDEVRRTIAFTNGERLDLHNVTAFDCSGTWLRIWADEGFAIIDPAKVNYHLIKPEGRPGGEEDPLDPEAYAAAHEAEMRHVVYVNKAQGFAMLDDDQQVEITESNHPGIGVAGPDKDGAHWPFAFAEFDDQDEGLN